MIPTGLVVIAPPGFYIEVFSRSGFAKDSIMVANAPGLIDPDYIGEIKVLLYNGGHSSIYIEHGMRIAQLVVKRLDLISYDVEEITSLPRTLRGDSGFGSTGIR